MHVSTLYIYIKGELTTALEPHGCTCMSLVPPTINGTFDYTISSKLSVTGGTFTLVLVRYITAYEILMHMN